MSLCTTTWRRRPRWAPQQAGRRRLGGGRASPAPAAPGAWLRRERVGWARGCRLCRLRAFVCRTRNSCSVADQALWRMARWGAHHPKQTRARPPPSFGCEGRGGVGLEDAGRAVREHFLLPRATPAACEGDPHGRSTLACPQRGGHHGIWLVAIGRSPLL